MTLNTSQMHLELDSIPVEEDPLIGKFFNDGLGTKFSDLALLRSFDSHWTYTYDSEHVGLRQFLQDPNISTVCPNAEAFIEADLLAESTRSLGIPVVREYSTEELDSLAVEWIAALEQNWNEQSPPQEEVWVLQQVAKARCILQEQDHDTKERWALDDAFVKQSLQGNLVGPPSCNRLPAATLAPISSRGFSQRSSMTLLWCVLLVTTTYMSRR